MFEFLQEFFPFADGSCKVKLWISVFYGWTCSCMDSYYKWMDFDEDWSYSHSKFLPKHHVGKLVGSPDQKYFRQHYYVFEALRQLRHKNSALEALAWGTWDPLLRHLLCIWGTWSKRLRRLRHQSKAFWTLTITLLLASRIFYFGHFRSVLKIRFAVTIAVLG